MPNGRGQQCWQEFKERTNIHGFSEYGGMRSVAAKCIWLGAALVVSTLCVLQVYGLSRDFMEHKPVTNVEETRNPILPDIGIVLDSPELIEKVQGDPVVQDTMSTILQKPVFCRSRWNSGNLDRDTQRITGADVEQFNQDYKSFMPAKHDGFANVEILSWGAYEQLNSTNKLTRLGAGYFFHIGKRLSEVNAIRITANVSFPTHLKLLIGTSQTQVYDPAEPIDVAPGWGYTVNSLITVYERSNRYCGGENVRAGMSCLGYCLMQESAPGGCLPYLGDISYGDRDLCGTADHEECTSRLEACDLYCEKCRDCSHCHQIEATTIITDEKELLGQTPLSVSEPPLTAIQMKFLPGAKTYRVTEMYTSEAYISQLGGSLGLAFGLSILSIFHTVYSAFGLIMEGLKRGRDHSNA